MAEAAVETLEGNKDSVQMTDYFNSLPDELLILTFRYLPHNQLPRCSMVCRRWLRISSDDSLWSRTNLRNVKIPLESLAKLIQRGIRYLDMRSAQITDPDPWKRCFPKKYKSKLKELDVSLAHISSPGLAHLLRPCRKLWRLESISTDLNSHGCEAIGYNPELKVLNLFDSRGLDAYGLTRILQKCRKLEDLNLNQASLSLAAVNALTENLSPTITKLSLYNCSVHLQDSHVFDIVNRCPNLRFLNISFNESLTEAAFDKARTLRHLEELVEEREFSWNYPGDDFEHDVFLDEYVEDDFDDFFHDDSHDDDDDDYDVDINFVPHFNMNLDDENVDLDDTNGCESDDLSDSGDTNTSDVELLYSNENTDLDENNVSGDECEGGVDNNVDEENENVIEVYYVESSGELPNDVSGGDDDIASSDGGDEFGSDEADDCDDGDDEADDYDDGDDEGDGSGYDDDDDDDGEDL